MHYAMDDANDVLVAYKQVGHMHGMRCAARARLAEAVGNSLWHVAVGVVWQRLCRSAQLTGQHDCSCQPACTCSLPVSPICPLS
jgi:hypothetical protein